MQESFLHLILLFSKIKIIVAVGCNSWYSIGDGTQVLFDIFRVQGGSRPAMVHHKPMVNSETEWI